MTFNKKKFFNTGKENFYVELTRRVNAYFQQQDKSKHANAGMIVKTAFMFGLFFIPFIILFTGIIESSPGIFALWGIMGIGMSGIGLSIMHDANHGSYSSNRKVNRYLGYSMNLIGANAEIWKLQHNMLHHVYTNIHGVDDDIDTPPFLRFSPYNKRKFIHRFQFLYVWFFYALSTLSWVTTKEFLQAFKYKRIGLIREGEKFISFLTQLTLWKIFYYAYIIVIPLLFMPIANWQVFVGFVIMHAIAGLVLSLIFQTAHVMPVCEYRLVDHDTPIEEDWAVYEMKTTNNYAPNSRIFTWFVGGLNFQIEHHLFPQVCHVHYKSISKIVASTAREFGIEYNSQKNFAQAVWLHIKMLYRLGRLETIRIKDTA